MVKARIPTVGITVIIAMAGWVTSPAAHKISGIKLKTVMAIWYMK